MTTTRRLVLTTALAGGIAAWACLQAAAIPTEKRFTNSIGMELVRIEPGAFTMGFGEGDLPKAVADPTDADGRSRIWVPPKGDYDERPVHKVTISKPFYMGICEVTNDQYEMFDKTHIYLRGKHAFSVDNDEAVVFVSWHEARAFCDWLSAKEGLPYRLPTEAEWEYACRAGTATPYWSGDAPPEGCVKNPSNSWYPDPERGRGWEEVVKLHVGKTPPNPWGLREMHGNVEEWCHDWYGPYLPGDQSDPVGRADGLFRVTRGGSHGTVAFYLRSANRMATLPEDTSWFIGFRVVLGEMPATPPAPAEPAPLYQQNVKQQVPADVTKGPDPDVPYFRGPRPFIKIQEGSLGPLFSNHNHHSAIAECPNGDLLAMWYTTVTERGRELAVAASRLRYGADEWEPASPSWDVPDRNDHAPALWCDGKTLYHFNGFSTAATWSPLAIMMRTSTDNGATWSRPRIIIPDHTRRHQIVESVFRTREGYLVLPADATPRGDGGTSIHISRDGGLTWADAGGTIAGIHAGVSQTDDGDLIAFARGDPMTIPGPSAFFPFEADRKEGAVHHMPMSVSSDMGKTWVYRASPFPPINGGQRLALLRLKEGPHFLASFATKPDEDDPEVPPVTVTDASGTQHRIFGLFGALSYDGGKTWPVIRSISDEPKGYMSVCQGLDGVINLTTSKNHYAFNQTWLETSAPAEPATE